jgi:ABC-type multidrug transport system ATPase subunit
VLARVGALVESPSLYPHLSGLQNLEVTRRLLGCPRSSIERVLAQTGLTESAGQRVAEYSMGMRQRLGIALALLGSPELLILDEPTNGLDPAGIADLRRMLQDFATNQGMTVLVSSHLLGEIEQVATHLGVLHAGELKFQGTVNELRARSLPRMRLRCDDLASARAWLHAHSHPEAFSADDWITLAVESREAPRLLHHLFTAGIEVLDMALEQSSLETLFFNLTTTVKAAA